MEKKVAVFYEGAIAYYTVTDKKQGFLIARLFRYKGSPEKAPPEEFLLYKQGRHWVDRNITTNLVDDLGYAIESQQYSEEIRSAAETRQQGNGGIVHP